MRSFGVKALSALFAVIALAAVFFAIGCDEKKTVALVVPAKPPVNLAQAPKPPVVVPKPAPVVEKPPRVNGPLELAKAPASVFQLTATSEAREMFFAAEEPYLGLYGWESKNGGFQPYFEILHWKKGTPVARIDLPAIEPMYAGLSPKGTKLLFLDFGEAMSVSIYSLPDGKILRRRWIPDRQVVGMPVGLYRSLLETRWAAFVDEEKFVTIAASGQLQLWRDQEKPIYTVPPRAGAPPVTSRLIALSGDRKILAMPGDDCLEFLDVTTGKPLGRTSAGLSGISFLVSFSRNGNALASVHYPRAGTKSETLLNIWNAPSGGLKRSYRIDDGFAKQITFLSRMTWLDDKRLIFWDGNCFKGIVFDLDSGSFQCIIESKSRGTRFFSQSPNECLWYPTAGGLVSVQLPWKILPDQPAADFELLPRWFTGIDGLSRELLAE